MFDKLNIDDDGFVANLLIWGFWQLIGTACSVLLVTTCVAFVNNTIEPFVSVLNWFTEYSQGSRVAILVFVIIWLLGGLIRMQRDSF